MDSYDVVVVGGGPAGATAAHELAACGHSVLLLDRAGRIKPCGGAVPPQLLRDFAVPETLLVARIASARMVSPRGRRVDIPVGDGFVGMVDRETFDEWLRERAASAGAERRAGIFRRIERAPGADPVVCFTDGRSRAGAEARVRARLVIGADGALSGVARQEVPGADAARHVFAYHEVIETSPSWTDAYDPTRCDVYYQGALSPDFYAWVFPHGATASVGTGSLQQGFGLRDAVRRLREASGLADAATVRREGAPIPLAPLRRWENGHDVVLAGDAAGVVAPASGEGIFYAMTGGRLAARSAVEALAASDARGRARALAAARSRFLRAHGQVFRVLGVMQRYWYSTDARRERFVAICRDEDVQRLTFDAYMHKRLVRGRPLTHARIFFKNLAHLAGLVPA
ncbi:MAG: geranylgeranyl diphosphate reductase [Gemmatirosa sp.]